MQQAEILILAVIYNTHAETLRYLKSIETVAPGNIALVLADNSDREVPVGFVEKTAGCPFVTYLKTGKNLGYFGGAREAFNCYQASHAALPRWILVTNVDIVFTPGFFLQLAALPDSPGLGMVAPAILSERWHADYNPKISQRYSRKKLHFYLFLYSSFLIHNAFLAAAYLKRWINGRMSGPPAEGMPEPRPAERIYAPHGSCLVFHRNYFERGGTIDLPNFLFGEEVLVAETARQLNLDVMYHPEMIIRDYEHASTGFFISPRINRYNREAIRSILERYYC